MKTPSLYSRHLVRSSLLLVGVGSALAFAPLRASAQSSEAAKEKASQSQPGDPVESKEGKLNAAEPGGQVKLTAQEALYVHDMGAANVAEIRLGELALKNAQSQEVKDYAQMMIDAHSKANDELSQVAKNHNLDFPPGPPAAAAEVGETLLSVKGAEFDKKYMGQAVKDHTNVLAEYKKAQGQVKDHLLEAYVKDTEPKVAEHLKKAKEIDAQLTK